MSSCFKSAERDNAFAYKAVKSKTTVPHCSRYKPNYDFVRQRTIAANFNLAKASEVDPEKVYGTASKCTKFDKEFYLT